MLWYDLGFICFVVVLCHSSSISIISWWWYDVWDEEQKAQVYLLPTEGIFNLPLHRYMGMVWDEPAFDDAANYTKWGNELQHSKMLWQWQDSYPCHKGHQPSALTNWAMTLDVARLQNSNNQVFFYLLAGCRGRRRRDTTVAARTCLIQTLTMTLNFILPETWQWTWTRWISSRMTASRQEALLVC